MWKMGRSAIGSRFWGFFRTCKKGKTNSDFRGEKTDLGLRVEIEKEFEFGDWKLVKKKKIKARAKERNKRTWVYLGFDTKLAWNRNG